MSRQPNWGFTLVELLVVIAIIGVLIGIAIPAVQQVRESARRLTCETNIREIGKAVIDYQSSRDRFPSAATIDRPLNPATGADATVAGFSYFAMILPNLEHSNIRDNLDFRLSPYESPNVSFYFQPVSSAICPTFGSNHPMLDASPGTGNLTSGNSSLHYQPVMGAKQNCPNQASDVYAVADPSQNPQYPCLSGGYAINGIMYPGSRTQSDDVRDGLTHTFLVGERSVPWTLHRSWLTAHDNFPPGSMWATSYSGVNVHRIRHSPPSERPDVGINQSRLDHPFIPERYRGFNPYQNDVMFGSMHSARGANFVMGDGSTRFLSENTDPLLLKQLASRAGGEMAQLPQ